MKMIIGNFWLLSDAFRLNMIKRQFWEEKKKILDDGIFYSKEIKFLTYQLLGDGTRQSLG